MVLDGILFHVYCDHDFRNKSNVFYILYQKILSLHSIKAINVVRLLNKFQVTVGKSKAGLENRSHKQIILHILPQFL